MKNLRNFDYHKDEETGLGFRRFSYGPCLNLTPLDEIEGECISKGIEDAEFFGYATHEQYFYPDYYAYQPDYSEKIMRAAEIVHRYGYEYFFIEEIVK